MFGMEHSTSLTQLQVGLLVSLMIMMAIFACLAGLLERSAANKDKYNKERLDSYYRRNYQVSTE